MSAHPKVTVPRPLRRGLTALVLSLPLLASAAPDEAGRRDFIAAYSAANAGLVTPAADSHALLAHPLYPWLRGLRLRQSLASGGAVIEQQAQAFLAELGEAPAGVELRRALLGRLAERGDWPAFQALWRDAVADERLRCRAAEAAIATGSGADAGRRLADRWVSEAELPAECNNAFAWFQRQPAYSAALVGQRLRSRLRDGDITRAKALLPELPASQRAPLEAWLQLLEKPADGFAALATGTASAVDEEGLRESFARYARRDTAAAQALLPSLLTQRRPSAATAQGLILSVALPLSWSRDPAALHLFKQAGDRGEALDERAHEWRVRAAVWAGDWSQALDWLAQLPPALAAQPRWRYWKARTLEATGRPADAGPLYAALRREFDSYGLFAAWRLGEAWTPPSRKVAEVTPEARAALDALPAFLRAEEAWALQYKGIASLEWRAAYDALDARHRPAMVALAGDWGWHDQAVVTATRQALFDDVPALFPRPWRDPVASAAAISGTPEEWIYGVMRKESVFKADAVSSADAIGLLQLLPSTAKLVARRHQRPVQSREQLFDPAINVPLGALHLKELADKYEGRWIMALGAYNAGSRAAERWRPVDGPREADVWIENIPYNETRGYIQRILLHVAAYRWLATGKPVRANNWLPPIPPAAPAP